MRTLCPLRIGVRSEGDRKLSLDPRLGQEPLGTVVPYVHLHDLAVADDEAVDVAVSIEGGSVRPFAVERAEIVDDGLPLARHHVGALHFLLHPLVALGVECRGFARMAIFPAAGKGDGEVVGDIARGGLGIGHHRRVQEGLHDAGRVAGFVDGCDSTRAGVRHDTVSRTMIAGSLWTIRTRKSMRSAMISYTILHTIVAVRCQYCLLGKRSAPTN